jgi:hypothetical protein
MYGHLNGIVSTDTYQIQVLVYVLLPKPFIDNNGYLVAETETVDIIDR